MPIDFCHGYDARAQNPSAAAHPPGLDELVSQLYGNRGAASFYLKRYDKCIADCTAAIHRNPYNFKALHRRGLAWATKKEPEKAEQDLTQALQFLTERSEHPPPQQRQQSTSSQEGPSVNVVPARESVTDSGSSKPSIEAKILEDLNKVRFEAHERAWKEKEMRKALLLQSISGPKDKCFAEPLRPLEVQMMRCQSVRHQLSQKAASVLGLQHDSAAKDTIAQQQQQEQALEPQQADGTTAKADRAKRQQPETDDAGRPLHPHLARH